MFKIKSRSSFQNSWHSQILLQVKAFPKTNFFFQNHQFAPWIKLLIENLRLIISISYIFQIEIYSHIFHLLSLRSSHQRCSLRKGFLKIQQNLQKKACTIISFLLRSQAWGLQVCFCEFCEIFKNTFFK